MINEAVKDFCKDFTKIENYDKAIADTTQTWHCHHRLETHNSDGEKRLVNLSIKELKALDMYYNRPPEEFTFLTQEEHKSLHSKTIKRNKEWCENISKGKTGKKRKDQAWNKGKKIQPCTEERKNLLSNLYKGRHWKVVDGKRVWY